MQIIDSHTHLDKNSDLTQLFSEMKKCGIGRIIFSNLGEHPAYPTSAELRRYNQEAWELVQKFPDKLSFLIYLNPQLPDWIEELQRHAAHAVGVKLWISIKSAATGALEATGKVLKACGQRHIPVLLHVFNRSYHNLSGEIDILELEKLAYAAPQCTMIAAHAGACIHDSRGIFRRLPANVYWDLSGSFPANNLLDDLLQELPSSRILYGSDALGRSFASQLLKVFAAKNLAPEAQKDILWRNAAQIYQLPAPPDLAWSLPLEKSNLEYDYNCYCGRDPFGIAPEISPEQLNCLMIDLKVKAAFCANLNSILHWDPIAENCRFVESCRAYSRLRPLWTVNVAAHNFEHTAEGAQAYAVGGIWTSCYWSAIAPDSPAILRLGQLCEQMSLPLFLHLGGPAEDRFRFTGLTPHIATSAEIVHLLEALPQCSIYVQKSGGNLPLKFSSHHIVDFFPADYSANREDVVQHVYGSGLPFRSIVSPNKFTK